MKVFVIKKVARILASIYEFNCFVGCLWEALEGFVLAKSAPFPQPSSCEKSALSTSFEI